MNFSPKRIGESEIFTADFFNQLAKGEVITSAVWTNSVKTGTDPSPNAMISGNPTINGSRVSQLISGGVANVTYLPICTAQTNLGQTLVLPEFGNGNLLVTQ